MRFQDIFKLAFESVRSNLLRSSLTLSIIAIGIMALIGILTAIDGIKSSISSNFASLGANSFEIIQKGTGIRIGGGKRQKPSAPISYEEALAFKERYHFPATVSLSTEASFAAKLAYNEEATNPNIMVTGIDENYLEVSKLDIAQGRAFSENEVRNGTTVIIIGEQIASKLFNNKPEKAIDREISVSSRRFRIIGVLASKGSSGIFNSDNAAYIPLQAARNYFPSPTRNYNIRVALKDAYHVDAAVSEATAIMRAVRRLPLSAPDDFEFETSDKLSGILIDQLKNIVLAAYVIGGITLVGAGIGLMNIMLVAVAERTREIGVSKAIGAKNRTILIQFLSEAILICQLGGVVGIILGIAMGNAVSALVKGPFLVPWAWIAAGVFFCLVVGVVAGIYPAIKASRLDPIESLRYE